jgi:hypothetical protein
VTDTHIRILQRVAQYRQREFDAHDAKGHTGESSSAGRRLHLKRIAARTRGRVVEAEARRRYARLHSISWGRPPLCFHGRAGAATRDAGSRLEAMSTRHLDDLRAEAQHARQRYDLYKAKAYGQRPTSPARMRELERASEGAEARLRAAEAEERRASADEHPLWSLLILDQGASLRRSGSGGAFTGDAGDRV